MPPKKRGSGRSAGPPVSRRASAANDDVDDDEPRSQRGSRSRPRSNGRSVYAEDASDDDFDPGLDDYGYAEPPMQSEGLQDEDDDDDGEDASELPDESNTAAVMPEDDEEAELMAQQVYVKTKKKIGSLLSRAAAGTLGKGAKSATYNPLAHLVHEYARRNNIPVPVYEKPKLKRVESKPVTSDGEDEQQEEGEVKEEDNEPSEAPDVKEAREKREKQDRQKYESWVLNQAKLIEKQRKKYSMPCAPEPKRNKAHWDHLLEEMEWLAKDFMRERKQRLQTAKKYASTVSKSNLGIEARQIAREKEAQEAVRKRAKWVGQQVAAFWNKAARVVATKVAIAVETKKKRAMDAQLEQIVGQTERYSKMLASNLTGDATKALPPPPPTTFATAPLSLESGSPANRRKSLQGDQQASKMSKSVSFSVADSRAPSPIKQEPGEQASRKRGRESSTEPDNSNMQEASESPQPAVRAAKHPRIKQEPGTEAEGAAGPESSVINKGEDVEQQDEEEDEEAPRRSSRRQKARAKAAAKESKSSKKLAAKEANDEDFELKSDEEDEEDDEETLAAEEAAEAAEAAAVGGKDKLVKAELNDLDEEANMSLEELMAKYGYEVPGENDEVIEDPEEQEEEEGAEEGEEQGQKDTQAQEGVDQQQQAGKDTATEGPAADGDGGEEGEIAEDGQVASSAVGQASQPVAGEDVAKTATTDEDKPNKAVSKEEGEADDEEGEVKDDVTEPPSKKIKADSDKDGENADKGDDDDDAVEPGSPGLHELVSEEDEEGDDNNNDPQIQDQKPPEAGLHKADGNAPAAPVVAIKEDTPEPVAKMGVVEEGSNNDDVHMASPSPVKMDVDSPAVKQQQQPASVSKVEAKQESKVETKAVAVDSKVEAAEADDRYVKMAREIKAHAEEEAEEEEKDEDMDAVASAAVAAQPTGYTLATTQVKTKVPFLLKAQMREYQHIGLDWLVTIYKKRLNGILADEMGLGKTLQTIALLAHLACEEGCWGPHLVVVPTSVMLNWEMEFKKFCPAFKLLTYYGSQKQRKEKRQGWSKPNAFHICITSYTLVLSDAKMFRRKKWRYLILDEAHMIKNWKSQRWQTLLRFNSKRRLLITGTPLQNDLMELWSLMHFLMPDVFASHSQFKDWFCNPLTGMVEGSEAYNRSLVERLHGVLRPFLLRRMKSEVEKQMPAKHEHVVHCRLSKRQRKLYDEYMNASDTQATLATGNFMGVVGVLMQLRKVCNHPDLFEGRPIISAFDMEPVQWQAPSCVLYGMVRPPLESEIPLLMSDGISINPGGWGCSPAASLARGLLVAHAAALSAPTLWEAAQVEELQTTYDKMISACSAGAAHEAYRAPFCIDDSEPITRSAAEALRNAEAEGGGDARALITSIRTGYASLTSASNSYRILAASLAAQHARHSAWRASRLRATAINNFARCTAGGPVYGSDLINMLRDIAHPCSRGLNSDTVKVRDHTWVGESAASKAIWEGEPEIIIPTTNGTLPKKGASGNKVLIEEIKENGNTHNDKKANPAAAVPNIILPPADGADSNGNSSAAANGTTGEGNKDQSSKDQAAGNAQPQSTLEMTGAQLQGVLPAFANQPDDPEASWYRPRGLRHSARRLQVPNLVLNLSRTYEERAEDMEIVLRTYKFNIPKARTTRPVVWCTRPDTSLVRKAAADTQLACQEYWSRSGALHTSAVRGTLFFPDRKLVQFDCGKLQELDQLLRRLKGGGHRCLIFTQMAKMLDILEVFLNLHGHTYMRLDGATKPEQRQILMTRFNTDPKIFCFILSTRSGGVGINLTGADTVVFYDSDWNPAMDQQAQDRCHRIGQTREVHIYRFVSINTIEENILRKSDQKRQLDWLAIQSGGFNTDFLAKLNFNDFFGGGAGGSSSGAGMSFDDVKAAFKSVEDEDDAAAAAEAEKEVAAEMDEFTKDPPPTAIKGEDDKDNDDDDDDKDDDDKQIVKAEEDESAQNEEVAAVAAQMAGGATANDVLARLDSSLKPVEKYAVRLLEEFSPVDVEAKAAAEIAKLGDEGDWKAEEFARRKDEAELAEDSEEIMVEDWDTEEATAAYRQLAEQAKRHMEAQEAAMAAAQAAAEARAAAAAQAAADAEFYRQANAEADWQEEAPEEEEQAVHDEYEDDEDHLDMLMSNVHQMADNYRARGTARQKALWEKQQQTAAMHTEQAAETAPSLDAIANAAAPTTAATATATTTRASRGDRYASGLPPPLPPPPVPESSDPLDRTASTASGTTRASGERQAGSARASRAAMQAALQRDDYTATQPWQDKWDSALVTVINSALHKGMGAGQPLSALPWSVFGDAAKQALYQFKLVVDQNEICGERCKARFSMLLSGGQAAHAPISSAQNHPAVKDVQDRLARLYARMDRTQLGHINTGLTRLAQKQSEDGTDHTDHNANSAHNVNSRVLSLASQLITQAKALATAPPPAASTSVLKQVAGTPMSSSLTQAVCNAVVQSQAMRTQMRQQAQTMNGHHAAAGGVQMLQQHAMPPAVNGQA